MIAMVAVSVLLTAALLNHFALAARRERAQMAEYAAEVVRTRARLPFS